MKQHVYNLLKYKDLFIELVRKDVKLKYRNSSIGMLWSMLQPLLVMGVLTIVFSSLFKNNIQNFPVYALTGRIIYSFFSEGTHFALDSIPSNSQLIRKVYVPKYFFPISKICSSFITNFLAVVPLILVMFITGMHLSFDDLLIFIPLILLFFITIGAGLVLSTLSVFFRDIKHLYSVLLMLVMYTTPIFYPIGIIPDKYLILIEFNPLFSILRMFREILIQDNLPSGHDIVVSFSYACFLIIVGLSVFYKNQDRFIFRI
ncbi:ABC transporter permease [Paenibacillus humicola]|uniref:ABC transporter permease n=1 Tax=Paenibacillus humicola TaxID=3110540 RepID=UPI00237A0CF2|nr:ABC transporter permease [Paenibacillus humicola]